ncbi:tetratricopeptide repeat protein [Peristeroidobacter agariperforans]|uniref:tetratricopeptide repeat protein n=1 Tax=Peristeroidobacter agariperforans TaxID=268404 RepID=UPI001E48511A|nr:tetratricopeptide repeat protein [Peristeroidobacter agariperforans]
MRPLRLVLILSPVLVTGCTPTPDKQTLAELRNVPADTADVHVDQGLDRAMESYRRYLEETPKTAMTPEAMRRLADLKVEKQFGILGDGKMVELEAPEPAPERMALAATGAERPKAVGIADLSESQQDFERRATGQAQLASGGHAVETSNQPAASGPLEAIALYDQLLAEYPTYEHNDKVLYQKSRAYDELGRTEEAMQTMERLIDSHPESRYIDEVQFRRAEYFFTRRKFRDAERAYEAIIALGARSEYYELALYKLGWTLYKQDFYDEALHRYIALLDHKVSIGYDFNARHEEGDERRVADTFRVISLSFSNLGGPEVVNEYFAAKGSRTYEDRIYSNLGEFYLTKLRYHDAAAAYKAFIGLYPLHRTSPHFSMRVVEIYTKGGFQKLVLDSKKEFAKTYGVHAEYWRHFAMDESPEVVSYLKSNLKDLANHYHAQYQRADLAEEKPANYREALQWYREFLSSFPTDADSPPTNYQLADLLLEEKNFGEAAREYERTAYDYPTHEKAAAAGYAAIFAHREHLQGADEGQQPTIKRDTIASSLKFSDTFPQHEHAPKVLGAAADDLYQLKDFKPALSAAQKLIERYPTADLTVLRSAWTVAAHSSFDLAEYPHAELAYTRVLELTPETDEKRAPLVDNLAASIYKQGEAANSGQDYRAAANHFLRIKQAAPTSKIRAAAEYDAGAALIRLEDWTAAADVLDAFRRTYPEHELNREATKQIAFVYRQSGQVARAASEYERIAAEADKPELRGEALLLAGDLHEQGKNNERALAVYLAYVNEFPQPLDLGVETRSKIAELYKGAQDLTRYHEQLQQIVSIDAAAGVERTNRTRTLAARSALVLGEQLYAQFASVKLVQPFERSLQLKQQRMDAAMKSLGALVDYQVGDVTAAATYYMAEVYFGFNRSLVESERPKDLQAGQLQDYELALEENAFPFEEKAIGVHEKNLELIRSGIYNEWIEKSLAKLAQLMPARYAKAELSSGFLGSLDRYAYRTPSAPPPEPAIAANAGAPNAIGQ